MPRIPYAAKALIAQIAKVGLPTDHETDDVDGLKVARTVVFTHDSTADHLEQGALALALDNRVVRAEQDERGFVVTFVADVRADLRNPFVIEEIIAMADEPDDEGDETEGGLLTRDELQGTPVAQLREDWPEHADLRKSEIIQAILSEQSLDSLQDSDLDEQ